VDSKAVPRVPKMMELSKMVEVSVALHVMVGTFTAWRFRVDDATPVKSLT
jgi:hypothetical protein